MSTYRTLVGEHRHEIPKIKGSRFIATVGPASSRERAEVFVQRVKMEYHDARHTCSAYRLRADNAFRHDDDGEPSGSAGRPILQEIEARDLVDVVVAVTRYFGGTKLGVGGLVRAYGGAAGAALDGTAIRTVRLTRRIVVEHAYDDSGAISAALAATGVTPSDATYGERVRLTFHVPLEEARSFCRRVVDRTGGRAAVRDEGPSTVG
jgi:uncharacterized YigZ family protein